MDTPLTQTHAFIEHQFHINVLSALDTGFEPKVPNIDINKCRKNILHYGVHNHCGFTVFNKVKKYGQRENY